MKNGQANQRAESLGVGRYRNGDESYVRLNAFRILFDCEDHSVAYDFINTHIMDKIHEESEAIQLEIPARVKQLKFFIESR